MWHRKPAVAGAFYPGSKAALTSMIKDFFTSVVLNKEIEKKLKSKKLMGVISPHAGYVYSGPVAAYSYSQLVDRDYKLVVALAPSHQARFDGASIIPEGIYETPLGEVTIDNELGNKLKNEPHFKFIENIHKFEHSLEVQVPFLQYAIDTFSIVPIIIGTVDLDTCQEIAKELHKHLKNEKRKFIIVISTDLSHYYSYDKASNMDNIFASVLSKCDASELSSLIKSGKAEACGEAPLLTGITLAKLLGAKEIELLKYANSGDTSGDKSRVVGYLSAAIMG